MGVPLSLFAMQWDYQKLLARLDKEAKSASQPTCTCKSMYCKDCNP